MKNKHAGFEVFDQDPTPADELVAKPIKRHAKELQGKAKRHHVFPMDVNNGVYRVVSGGSGREYTVTMFTDNTGNCNCDWAAKRPLAVAENKGAVGCSHVLAVVDHIAAASGEHVSTWADPADAKRQHKAIVSQADGLVVTRRGKPTHKRYTQADFLGLADTLNS